MIFATGTTITKLGKKIAINRRWTLFHRQKLKASGNHLINRLVQAAIGTKYKLGLGTKSNKRRCWKKI